MLPQSMLPQECFYSNKMQQQFKDLRTLTADSSLTNSFTSRSLEELKEHLRTLIFSLSIAKNVEVSDSTIRFLFDDTQ